jgi:hypothetical protein
MLDRLLVYVVAADRHTSIDIQFNEGLINREEKFGNSGTITRKADRYERAF